MPSREPELYKDKVEVSLDGRQIFYLFFGGAVIVGMVFVLGVLVGRRVEARGHLDRADTQAASDPLAALDRLERSDHLSFHGALTGAGAPTDVDKAIGEIERRRTSQPAKPEKPDKAPAAAGPTAGADVRAVKLDPTPVRPEARSGPEVRSEPVTRPEPEPRSDKHGGKARPREESGDAKSDRSEPRGDGKAARADKSSAKSDVKSDAKPEAKPDAKSEAKSDAKPDAKSAEGKVRFTLQLSSFQDRSEAEAFLGATKAAGFQPYLTEADVSGKGTFYRVRLGSYRSLEAANDAKAEYDKSARKPAQVMRL
jgi:cell division septation protein DedD